ncbi:MAG: LysR family transcriptional regulator [Selenomonadaceae bacterium]|nr:LysR family transcriptional regulator [Selenomonadaceae bacterium]
MTLNQMYYFCEVCKLQNITKASQVLNVSQPTISIAIRDLESETKLNLLHRQGKKIIITQDGYKLFVKISNILSQIQELNDEINRMTNRNIIRLAIPIQIGTIFLPRILGDFKNKFPSINFDIIETGGIDSLNLLENDKIDLAITNYKAELENKFVYHKFFSSECCFCTYKDHFLSEKEILTFEDIAEEKLVMLDSSFLFAR